MRTQTISAGGPKSSKAHKKSTAARTEGRREPLWQEQGSNRRAGGEGGLPPVATRCLSSLQHACHRDFRRKLRDRTLLAPARHAAARSSATSSPDLSAGLHGIGDAAAVHHAHRARRGPLVTGLLAESDTHSDAQIAERIGEHADDAPHLLGCVHLQVSVLLRVEATRTLVPVRTLDGDAAAVDPIAELLQPVDVFSDQIVEVGVDA